VLADAGSIPAASTNAPLT